MSEHVHGCLNCRPDMVPDFRKDDPRYHDGEKCRTGRDFAQIHRVTLNGAELAWTHGHFEGTEGWALFIGEAINLAHPCSCVNGGVCVEPCFGVVASEHMA